MYREGVGGRLAGLRLASADARTAEYLADKILLLEAGQALPATLAETDLRFHLYESSTQLDLLLRDYQGEHVALGREEPIREFLRECDAIWLCLDVSVTENSSTCLRAQQEVEQLVEDYLAAQPPGTPHRPMALILTKARPAAATSDCDHCGNPGSSGHDPACPGISLSASCDHGRQLPGSGGRSEQRWPPR